MTNVQIIRPNTFEPQEHWYPKAYNATIHPMVAFFLNLDHQRIVERYCHLHPKVKREDLLKILQTPTKYFLWGGADLINVTTEDGKRQMVVIENNSCPSGQKSMPLLDDNDPYGSYKKLIDRTFTPHLKGQREAKDGVLAVIYDKNPMEASGYAAAMADTFDEDVYYIYFPKQGYEDYIGIKDDFLHVKNSKGEWIKIRAAFRYVTQKPWNRIPINCKTRILNPIIACLSGGRNKMVAAKAYDLYNAALEESGLKISMPETIWDVSKNEVPIWVQKMGGQAVVKIPYSNAGQGVFTIVSERELDDFMSKEYEYDSFIVQSLIGNYNWSSRTSEGKFYHVGTIPSARGNTFVTDIRLMVSSSPKGIYPLGMYSRRARDPLLNSISGGEDSWGMLGTNLSVKLGEDQWGSDTHRLVLMDRRDFNQLGLGLDDLIEAFIQTVLSMVAIDQMARNFMGKNGQFKKRLFTSFNDDDSLLREIYRSE